MESEHRNAGGLMNEIRSLCGCYTAPKDACRKFAVAYEELKEFEEDLHMHISLENNILFPRAILIEDELKSLKLIN
jgi:regulator of cell morphogenesis and NO signaling